MKNEVLQFVRKHRKQLSNISLWEQQQEILLNLLLEAGYMDYINSMPILSYILLNEEIKSILALVPSK